MIAADLHALQVPIDSLHQLPGNPRRGDVDAVAASLQRFGQRKPIVAKTDGTITAGNHTWQAAKQLGWDSIAVVRVDDDDATASAFALADNRTAELGSYDDELLLDLIQSIDDKDLLADTGWSDDAVADLLAQIGSDLPDLPPPDEAAEPPVEPQSKPGDVWILGGHRVVCGDATDVLAYDALLGDDKADCVWTDPPYGVDYVGKTADALTIRNDGAKGLDDLLAGCFAALTTAGKPGAAVYVAHPPGALSKAFLDAFLATGWRLHQTLVWDKTTIALGHSDYHYSHEPILFGYMQGGGSAWPRRVGLVRRQLATVSHCCAEAVREPGTPDDETRRTDHPLPQQLGTAWRSRVGSVRRFRVDAARLRIHRTQGAPHRVGSPLCGCDLPPLAGLHRRHADA